MCNEYEQHTSYVEYCKVVQNLALGVPIKETELDMPPGDDIRIGDMAPVIRAAGDNIVELAQMKFGFPPTRAHGPLFNYRSQRRHFGASHRCLVPASAFFEFTGKNHPRVKHRFTLVDAPFMAIAAIWRPGRKGQPSAFAMLTTEPGSDVKPFHNRQVVILRPGDWKAWIDLDEPEEELLRPLPAGSLNVEWQVATPHPTWKQDGF
ncbi:SOS response-associated peptidase family protein [Rhizobium sp. S96]|uniref:SOS response-associated peptidase n=1 Tax=Rhizobium sp. S96 TaxID=3055140 RepID=UPI0025AA3455|nr:SOS response-associated peptidase family protein [Rhizobium sp. S96]MDM9622037.1 SOS response-associated peptidase family protein [Rhizobium sp. S96]